MKTQHFLLPTLTLASVIAFGQTGTEQATDPASAVEPTSETSRAPLNVLPGAAPMPALNAEDNQDTLQKLVDNRISNIERSLENAPTAEDREAAKAQLATLRQRRDALRQEFKQSDFDKLVEDSRTEYARVASWSSKRTGDAAAPVTNATDSSGSRTPTAVDNTYAALNLPANKALANIELYRLNPSPDNKSDVKVALKALSKEIDRLDDQADNLPKGAERDAAKRRVKALKERQSDLKHDFTKARWDAMVNDLRAEWNKLVH